MTDLSELIAKLEGLSGPDREVDGLIFGWLHNTEPCGTFMCGFDEEKFQFRHPDDPKEGRHRAWYVRGDDLPAYTASLDAAVALVERAWPGWKKQFFEDYNGLWIARISSPRRDLYSTDYMRERDPGGSSNGAIALCLALLRSLEGRDE